VSIALTLVPFATPNNEAGMADLNSDRGSASVDASDLRLAREEQSFLLRRVQPAMAGLIDGSLSSLAPIFAVVLATHQPRYAFFAGLATAIGAGVSMAFSEGLSDTGDVTGRGSPYLRGAITGAGTFLGGILHTLPFLIPQFQAALIVAVLVVAFELVVLAWMRWRFFETGFLRSFLSITLGGVIIVAISAALGGAAG
jgi:VIT1/CCC1 family predicted Fe2+/Mn2+ transporter